MKLKKIASLALAGVMALSMLAGCANGTNNDNNTNNDVNIGGATGVSAKVNDLLDEDDKVTLTDNATYASYLASAIKEADLDAEALLGIDDESWDTDPADVLTEVQDLFANNVLNYDKTSHAITNFTAAPSAAGDVVYMSVAAFPGEMGENVVLQKIADKLNLSLTATNLPEIIKVTTDYYDVDYTGSVSLQKVSDGSASAWIAVVTFAVDTTKR